MTPDILSSKCWCLHVKGTNNLVFFSALCWQEAGSQELDTSAKTCLTGQGECNRFEVLLLELESVKSPWTLRWWFGRFGQLLIYKTFSFFFLSLRVLASPLWLSPLWKTSNCTVSDHPLFPPVFLPKLSKAIITAPQCKSVLAMADKGWEIVSNDGSTSAETSQSCLFQQ